MAGKKLTPERRIARFWSFVDKITTPEGCWTWTGFRMPRGYGNFQSSDPSIGRLAHRYAYATFVGPIEEGREVMHRCDNPPCVRPDHLALGTRADNMGDAVKKGRQARGEILSRVHRNRGRRLTPSQVREIRSATGDGLVLRRSDGLTRALAIKYGVTYQMIRFIRSGRAWRYLK